MIRTPILAIIYYLSFTGSCFSFNIGRNSRSRARCGALQTMPVEKTEEEWKEILDDESFTVLRQGGTEPPFSSPLNEIKGEEGILCCKGCGETLFPVSTKFDSGTGWPSFFAPVSSKSIAYNVDFGLILPRTECSCASCGGHLGHVFEDGPQPTGLRYCMNGAAMILRTYDNAEDTATPPTVEPPSDAAQLPLASILPGAIVNFVVSALFFVSWAKRDEYASSGIITLLYNNFPLPASIYYCYLAISALQKAKLS